MNSSIKFEEALLNLEEIVRQLESGSLSLDESIKRYEEAIKYVKICTQKLVNAEQKIKILTEGVDGAMTDMPFVQNEN